MIRLYHIAWALPLALSLSTALGAETVLPKLDQAAERGLAYLARQQHDDGSLDADLKTAAQESLKPKMATTALSLLAFLAEGHMPDMGRYGATVRGTLDYLVTKVPEDGYVGNIDGSRMYGQGIVTLALAEAYGVETVADKRRLERAALHKLVAVILAAQDVSKPDPYAGGWRYEPTAADSDISLSGWNALALRAAQEVGMPVPAKSLQRAADFVARCYSADSKSFAYQPGGERRSGANATGVLCMFILDAGSEDRVKARQAARSLADHPIDDQNAYPFYSLYYVTHAAFQAGDDVWKNVAGISQERLISSQSPDGSWTTLTGGNNANSEPGKVYRTAMAVLTLSVPQRLLPIYAK